MASTLYVEKVKLGRNFTLLDELFDLALFKELHELESGEVQVVLSRLIATEQRHVAFWQENEPRGPPSELQNLILGQIK
jgi:hypothetical protein